MRVILLAAVLTLLLPGRGAAQVEQPVAAGDRIRVRTTEVPGLRVFRVLDADPEALAVRGRDGESVLRRDEISELWVRGRRESMAQAVKGAALGGLAGAALVSLVVVIPEMLNVMGGSSDDPLPREVYVGAAAGAALGGFLAYDFASAGWIHVAIAAAPGAARGGLAISISF
jgi:hypothetical protein